MKRRKETTKYLRHIQLFFYYRDEELKRNCGNAVSCTVSYSKKVQQYTVVVEEVYRGGGEKCPLQVMAAPIGDSSSFWAYLEIPGQRYNKHTHVRIVNIIEGLEDEVVQLMLDREFQKLGTRLIAATRRVKEKNG